MNHVRLILALSLFASPAACWAGTFTQNQGAASLEVYYEGDTRKIALSDLISVTLTIEGSPALRTPIAPLELAPAAPWVLVERSRLLRDEPDSKRVRYRLLYRFAPREPGKRVRFHFPQVKFKDGAGAEQTVAWTPIVFEVETQIAQPDPATLRDITEIEGLAEIETPARGWLRWSIAASVLLVLALALGVCRWLRRAALRTPAQLALYEWHRLMALKLPEKGRSERFITLLTLLVRQYLERQCAFPARRQTTPEFIQQLEEASTLTVEEKRFLKTFLTRCESVKFAAAPMPVDECNEWAHAAQQFLERQVNPSLHTSRQ